MTNTKAQVGDLIRIVNAVVDEQYDNGDIFEVDELALYSGDVYGINPQYIGRLYIEEDEYVIHRKAGEEDSGKKPSCQNCGASLGTNGYDGYCDVACKSDYTGVREEYLLGQSADAVNSPQHYTQGRVEVIDIIEDAVEGATPFEAVCQANILKYTLRYRAKNGVTDLLKAKWYLERLVAHIEK